MVRYYYDGINTLLERQRYWNDFYDEWRWRTLRVYTLAPAAMGQIAGERTMTAWHPQTGAPTAWSDRWYHYDMLGNVTGELDASGLVESHVWMEAFGTVLTGGQTGRRLTTKCYDEAARGYYIHLRWLDPMSGRFVQHSPYEPFVEHQFLHVQSMPTIGVDWFGDLMVAISGKRWWEIYREFDENRRAGHRRFPGEKNSAMRHCVTTCEQNLIWGSHLTRFMGDMNELQGHIMIDVPRFWTGRRWGAAWSWDDLKNNEHGHKCADQVLGGHYPDCEACCECRVGDK
jgi:hypothetical protein